MGREERLEEQTGRRARQGNVPGGKKTAGSYVRTAGGISGRRRRYNVNLDYVPHVWKGKLERDLRVDNVRGVLIILVVIGHFLLPLYQTRLITNLFYLIYTFHMPCFVMISGFYAKSLYRGGRFRIGKVIQLLWLYFVYEMVVNVTEGLLTGEVMLFPDFLHESGAPWYLLALSIWYLSIPFFARFREYPVNAITLFCILVFCLFIKYFMTTKDLLCLDRVVSFAPFFYIGYYYNQENLDNYLQSPARKTVDRLALLIAAGIFLFAYDFLMRYNLVVFGAQYSRYDPPLWPWLWLINLLWYLAAFLLSMGLIGIMLNRRMLLLTTLGQRSLQIYMIHRPLRDLMQYFGFYELLNPHSKLTSLFIILFSTGLCALLGSEPVYRSFRYLRNAPDRLLEKLGVL